MRRDNILEDEKLEKISGGREVNILDSQDDSEGLQINTRKKYTKECKFCGGTMTGTKKGTFIVYKCSCGAKYQPGIANPWIEPKQIITEYKTL